VLLSKLTTTLNLPYISPHNPYFQNLKLRWIKTFWSHSLNINWLPYDIATPHTLWNPKSFHKQRIPTLSENLRHKRSTSFYSNPKQMNCCRSQTQSANQGTHSLRSQVPSHLIQSSKFCIIFITSLWQKLLCNMLFL